MVDSSLLRVAVEELKSLGRAKKRLIKTSRNQVQAMNDLEQKVLSLEQRYKTDSQKWIEEINELQQENKNT